MVLLVNFLLYLLFAPSASVRGEWGQIKINEPKQQYSSNYGSYNNDESNSYSSSSSYRDPHSETDNSEIVLSSVVEYLTARKGDIIEGTHDKYTYKIDLFNKVEQSENYYSWNLGIFDKWDYCDSTETEICLQYNDGQICGNGNGRSSHVHIVCDIGDKDETKEHLYDVTEPNVCSYHMNMFIPPICDLINNDINTIFSAAKVQDLENNGQINIIGDNSGLNNKLNEIMDKQNAEKELDHLWKLCLMSLIVDDDTKLNKIRNVINMMMVQNDENDNDENDSKQTDICDFYLEQMLKSSLNDEMETMVDAETQDDLNNEDIMDVMEEESKMGGLIGAILNQKDEHDDVEYNVKKEDRIQNGDQIKQNDIIAEKDDGVYDTEFVAVNSDEIGEYDL